MSRATARLLGAAALLAGLGAGMGGGGPALACGRDCDGYRPAPVYAAPPVYSHSYAPYTGYGLSFYTSRVDIFRGPRWGFAAADYSPRGRCTRRCAHRAYLLGPIVYVRSPWRRGWRR